ncbi:MAG: cytochrome c family protein [Devosia sp.]|nr:cytochrome c family protein [Devosia sp.]
MDSFELNKIIGAVLGTLLFVMGVGFLAEGIYAPITSAGASYDLPEPTGAGGAAAAPKAPAVPLPELLAKADPVAGADSAKKCQSCHDFTEGGANKTGPALYDVVGREIASHPDYPYSDALKADAGQKWTYENLDKWLTSPKTFAPGTKMTFIGISDDAERADVIAYLRSLSHNPVPFPQVAAAAPAAAPAAAAPASTTAPAATPAASTAAPAAAAAPAASGDTTAPAPATPAPAAGAAAPAATAPAATAPATTAPATTTPQ